PGRARPRPGLPQLFGPARARLVGGADLVGKQADVERAGRLVLFHVLAVGLVALDEVALRPPEAPVALEPDQHGLGDNFAPELARTTSTHTDLPQRRGNDDFTNHTPGGDGAQ